jgi:hypothetical protein
VHAKKSLPHVLCWQQQANTVWQVYSVRAALCVAPVALPTPPASGKHHSCASVPPRALGRALRARPAPRGPAAVKPWWTMQRGSGCRHQVMMQSDWGPGHGSRRDAGCQRHLLQHKCAVQSHEGMLSQLAAMSRARTDREQIRNRAPIFLVSHLFVCTPLFIASLLSPGRQAYSQHAGAHLHRC